MKNITSTNPKSYVLNDMHFWNNSKIVTNSQSWKKKKSRTENYAILDKLKINKTCKQPFQ